jgi:hypothetical protein
MGEPTNAASRPTERQSRHEAVAETAQLRRYRRLRDSGTEGAFEVGDALGPATVVEEVRVAQHAGERRFATTVQLLEAADGEPLVRIAYSTDGVVRRGPVTLRARDLERLRAAVAGRRRLASALGCAADR